MSVPWKCATIKVHSSSVLKVTPHVLESLFKAGLDCEWNFAEHSEVDFILNVPKAVGILAILNILRALWLQNNIKLKLCCKKYILISD